MKSCKGIITILLFLNFFLILPAKGGRTLFFNQLNTLQGLSQNTILSIAQDQQDFIWFGTMDGLNRFDGYEIKVFKEKFDDSTSLQNNRINAITVDEKGFLWVGTDKGLHRYNPKTEKFKVFSPPLNHEFTVYEILTLNSDSLLVGTSVGVFLFDVAKNRLRQLKEVKKGVRQIKKSSDGKIWIACAAELHQYKNSHLISVWTTSPRLGRIIDFSVQSDSVVWLLTHDNFLKIDLKKKRNRNYTPKILKTVRANTIEFSAILPVGDKNLWIASNKGLLVFNRPDETFSLYKDENKIGNLSSRNLTVLFQDRQGIVWVGTHDAGVNYIDPQKDGFFNILYNSQSKNSLSNPLVYAIYKEGKDILWIGTDDGLDRLNLKTNRFRYFKQRKGGNSISNNHIRCIIKDNRQNLWVGTYDGLNKINLSTFKISTFRPYKGYSQKNVITKLYLRKNGEILVGLKYGGLFRFDPEKEIFKRVELRSGININGNTLFVTDIKEDSDGNLLIGTYGHGLLKYYVNEDVLDFAFPGKSKLNKLCSAIYSIFVDQNGMIWIGTYGQGLHSFNPKTSEEFHVGTKEGLRNNVIYGILEDKQKNLWISTNKGLSQINPSVLKKDTNKSIRIFDFYDGLQSNEFNFGAYFKDDRGILYFGGVRGLTFFNPDNFTINKIPPTVSVTRIKINNKDWEEVDASGLNVSVPFLKSLNLNYDQNSILIEFTALHFSGPRKNRFAYKLEGVDKDWVYTNANNRIANYRHLKGGKYKFLVKASNAYGIWTKQPRELIIKIDKPIWERLWFQLSLLLIFVLIFYIAHRYRTETIRKRNQVLNELNRKLEAENEAKVKAMSALKENIEKFRTIFNDAPLGIFYINKESILTDCNQNFINIIGASYKELCGLHLLKLLKDEKLKEAIKAALSVGSGFYEGRYHSIIGNKVTPVRVHISGIHAMDGSIIGGVGIVEDLTEYEEEKLRESIIHNIVSAVHTTDDLESFYQIFESELSKVINTQNLFVALFDREQEYFTLPLMRDQKDRFEKVPAKGTVSYHVIQRGKATLFKEKDFVRLKESGVIEYVGTPSKCWLGVPLRIKNQIIGILVVQDYEDENAFDERNLQLLEVLAAQLASAIKQKQDREVISLLTRGIEQSSLTLIIADRDGSILYDNINQQNLMQSDLKDRQLIELLSYKMVGDSSVILKSLEKGEKWSGEIQRKFDDDVERWEFLSINPIYNSRKQMNHFVIVSEDITEAKRLQNQLAQSQKIESIGTLAGGIAHDFNNLLTVINGHAEMALIKLNKSEKIHSDIISILHAGKKAANLTRQLLAFSRKQMFKADILNLNEVINNMDKMLRRLIGEDIIIELQLAPNMPYIKADPSQLEQVLLNLIVNARDAIHEWEKRKRRHKKVITIITEKVILNEKSLPFAEIVPGTYVQLIVRDSGIGMNKETQQKVFEPFFTTKEVGKGTGLGLSTVYGIVKQNRGYIRVKSEEGVGTEFTVYWPVALKQHRKQKGVSEDNEIAEGKETILVVEDDPSVRNFIRDILEQSGYRIFEAKNGKEAFDILRKIPEPIDLVVTDMVMPEMNGNELADQIRFEFSQTKILFTSGYTESRILRDGLINTDMHFLHKPFTVVELTQAVRKALE
ncbi:MAG: response regulator [Calditrichaeota bacterium]|nr:response regulator [Calditrichota bacterium]